MTWWALAKGYLGFCHHEHCRCIHGDEIRAVGMRRSQCLDCGRFLEPLPEICSVTGVPH